MDIRKLTLLVSLSTLMHLLSGCSTAQKPSSEVTTPSNPDKEQLRDAGFAKRFQESTPQNPTAVESAIELSGKYAKLSEEASVLRQENQQFKNRLTPLESQLQQTQKELNEANDLLIEMRIELNNWKADILGFRDEMHKPTQNSSAHY